jgi:hypothetical protein
MNFIEQLNLAHKVVCPVCGSKASYVLTGGHSFKSEFCHEELNDLIDQRIRLVFNGIDPDSGKPVDI